MYGGENQDLAQEMQTIMNIKNPDDIDDAEIKPPILMDTSVKDESDPLLNLHPPYTDLESTMPPY